MSSSQPSESMNQSTTQTMNQSANESTHQPRPPPRYNVPRKSSKKVTLALLALVAVGFTYPFAYIGYHRSQNPAPTAARKSSYQSDAPLPPSSMIRGAYLNSGSKDIGYDDQYYVKHAAQLNALRQADADMKKQ